MKNYFLSVIITFTFSICIYPQSWFQQSSGTSRQLNSVFFINENLGWIVGSNGEFIKTTNGGTDWIQMSHFTPLSLTSVFFINENIGWAAVYYNQGQIYKTTDGGNTWVLQNQTVFPGYFGIQFTNADTGWAIYGENDYAKIMKTTNGGVNWYQVYVDSYAYRSLHGLCFINSETGWVVGDYKVLKSTDGGENWVLISSIAGVDLRSVCFINDSIGWIAGNNGKIMKSSNGGESWISQNTQTSSMIYNIQFVDENNGWAVGNGIVLKTIDGGNNWIPSLSGYTLLSLIFINKNIGWLVGAGGKIFNTMDGGAIPVEMTSLSVLFNKNMIELSWSTASELNNYGFEIERSNDQVDWRTIGFREGKGTTTQHQNYTFTDDLFGVNSHKLYYRLKQIDYDGRFEYSNVLEVNVASLNFSLYQNYPNPFNPSTVISYQLPIAGAVTLKIYDVLGREVAVLVDEYRDAGYHEVEFNINSDEGQNLTSGVYFYQLKVRGPETSSRNGQAGQGIVQTKKMLMIK